jgi:hypothetical protein
MGVRLEKAVGLLKGAKILEAVVEPLEEGDKPAWISLLLKLTDGQVIVLIVSRDDEGNGPGALLGLWDLAKERGI